MPGCQFGQHGMLREMCPSPQTHHWAKQRKEQCHSACGKILEKNLSLPPLVGLISNRTGLFCLGTKIWPKHVGVKSVEQTNWTNQKCVYSVPKNSRASNFILFCSNKLVPLQTIRNLDIPGKPDTLGERIPGLLRGPYQCSWSRRLQQCSSKVHLFWQHDSVPSVWLPQYSYLVCWYSLPNPWSVWTEQVSDQRDESLWGYLCNIDSWMEALFSVPVFLCQLGWFMSWEKKLRNNPAFVLYFVRQQSRGREGHPSPTPSAPAHTHTKVTSHQNGSHIVWMCSHWSVCAPPWLQMGSNPKHALAYGVECRKSCAWCAGARGVAEWSHTSSKPTRVPTHIQILPARGGACCLMHLQSADARRGAFMTMTTHSTLCPARQRHVGSLWVIRTRERDISCGVHWHWQLSRHRQLTLFYCHSFLKVTHLRLTNFLYALCSSYQCNSMESSTFFQIDHAEKFKVVNCTF